MTTKDYRKRTPSEKKHSSLMADAMRRLEFDILSTVVKGKGLPEEWQPIATNAEVTGPRDKITMRLDRDVLKFFRAMGPGYQIQIARVLRAWMHGRLAKVIEGPDTTDLVLRPEVIDDKLKRMPDWGDKGLELNILRYVQGYEKAQEIALAQLEGRLDRDWHANLEKNLWEAALQNEREQGGE